MRRKLRHLLFVTLDDPYDARAWSGTPYHMRLALESRIDKVSVLTGLKPKRTLITAALRATLGGHPPRYPILLTGPAQRQFARETLQVIDKLTPDAVLTISTHCVVGMTKAPPVPTFMVSDAPWLSWKETYKKYDAMPILGPRFGRLEAAASALYSGLIFPSDWAVDEAERRYGAPRTKLHSIPMGAMWTPDAPTFDLDALIDSRLARRVDLLFVGKDWERKGGPLAIQIVRALRTAGVSDAHLHIVGCNPPLDSADRAFVTLHGFLDVRNKEGSQTLRELFYNSRLLLVPTQAECFGLVFAEAQAFGLPPVTCAVQALPSIVADGVTGVLEPSTASPEQYRDRILALVRDPAAYRRMAHAARARFLEDLNWQRFADRTVEVIERSLT